MEAEGLMAEESNAVVQTLETAVREAVLDRGEDAGAILSDRACEFDEGGELGSRCPLEPVLEAQLGASVDTLDPASGGRLRSGQ